MVEVPPQVESVGRDAVYAELYNEMRRFRDYEFTSSTWYTALLVATAGFIAATRFDDPDKGFAKLLETHCALKAAVAAIAVLIATASSYLLHFCSARYRLLRDWTESIEPAWKQATFPRARSGFTPSHLYYITQWALVALITALLFMPAV